MSHPGEGELAGVDIDIDKNVVGWVSVVKVLNALL